MKDQNKDTAFTVSCDGEDYRLTLPKTAYHNLADRKLAEIPPDGLALIAAFMRLAEDVDFRQECIDWMMQQRKPQSTLLQKRKAMN